MTVIEYAKEKNKIVKKYSGIDLIPDWALEQLEEIYDAKKEEEFKKMVKDAKLKYELSSFSCPHCFIYRKNNCDGCVYKEMGEVCDCRESLWHKARMAIYHNADKEKGFFSEFKELVDNFIND